MMVKKFQRLFFVLALIGLAGLHGCSTLSPTPGSWRYDVPVNGQIRVPGDMSVDRALSEVTARSLLLLGTPYRRGGSSPREGFDCSGLVQHVFAETFNLKMPRTTEEQALVGFGVSRHQLEPGDLVFFNTLGRNNSHVGIYLGGSRFVHSPTRRGVVRVESINERYWSTRFDQARRLIARN